MASSTTYYISCRDYKLLIFSIKRPKSPRSPRPLRLQTVLDLHWFFSPHLFTQVPWPINIILNSKCMQIYNEVFSFLLQIKRAKYSLDRLSFEGVWHSFRHISKTLRRSRDHFLTSIFDVCPSVPFVCFCHPISLLRYADKRIVNIMKVYIESKGTTCK